MTNGLEDAMTKTLVITPRKTWRGKALMFWRALRGVLGTPKDHGVVFALAGTTLTGQKIVTLPAGPDQVWRAIWQNTLIDPPNRSIDDARAGQTIGYFSDLTQGRGWYWVHILALCEAADPGRHVIHRLMALDAEPDERIAAMLNEYRVEPEGDGTRLTIRVVDEKAGDIEMFRSFMVTAIWNDIQRILSNLHFDKPEPPQPRSVTRARRNAVTRA
jgi:hypothetical protein